MVQTDSDGRSWVHGLDSRDFKFSQRVDLVTAKAEGGSVRVAFANATAGAALFAKRPDLVTYLNSDATNAVTTITVKSTSGFPTSGYFYLNTETIKYTGTTATTFTGCTRGERKSLAQYHYTADGARLRYPEVTDHPVVLEGRRVRFYAYGAGDSRTGDGTLVWVGIAASDVSFDGSRWSFLVDSLFRVLDQELGSDLEDPSPIRGIYYPGNGPIVVEFDERAAGGASDTTTNAGAVALSGFWPTQAEFIAALQSAIDSELTAQSFNQTDVRVVEWGTQWAIQFTTDGSTARWMTFRVTSGVDRLGDGLRNRDFVAGRIEISVSTSTTYIYLPREDFPSYGTVPRAVFGGYGPSNEIAGRLDDSQLTDVNVTTYPPWRIYLGGSAGVTTNTQSVSVDWDSPDPAAFSGTFTATVDDVDSANRSLTLFRPYDMGPRGSGGGRGEEVTSDTALAVASSVPTVRMGRSYGVGTLADFLGSIVGQTAQYVNTGAVPFLRPTAGGTLADIDSAEGDLDIAAVTPMQRRRFYSVFSEVTLRDLVEHGCRLVGSFPYIDQTIGWISFRRLRLPSPTEINSSSITATVAITDDQILGWERAALGIYNTVRIRTGYDAVTDEYTGPVLKVRDVSAFGQSPNSRTLDIEPKSRQASGAVDFDDAIQIASRVLGVFGGPYVYLTIDVPLTLWGVAVGDVVSITWSKVPDSDGTLGVSDKLGLVTGWEFAPNEGRGTLTLLTTDQRITGYSPGAKINTVTSGTDGTTGPFTVDLSSDYFPSSTTAASFWTAGDKIRITRWGSTTTANNVTATVDSVASNSLTFTADSAWTRGSGSWAVDSQVSTAITAATQKPYAYSANADATLDFSGSTGNPAFTLAP